MQSVTENWDAVSGLGRTALATAAARAIETNRQGGLVRDPFAEGFVRRANPSIPMPTKLNEEVDGSSAFERHWDITAIAVGVRTRFFDDYFEDAWQDGLIQAVILAAGLDARAFRLKWPSGAVLFEVDKPGMHEFKEQVLREQQIEPRCQRRTVANDLRDDWLSGLIDQGFDPSVPTVWLAEGLMAYLSRDDENRLLDSVQAVCSDGSRVAFDHPADVDVLKKDTRRANSQYGFDLAALLAAEPDKDPAGYLRSRGWQVATSAPAQDDLLYCGRLSPYGDRDLARKWLFSVGRLSTK